MTENCKILLKDVLFAIAYRKVYSGKLIDLKENTPKILLTNAQLNFIAQYDKYVADRNQFANRQDIIENRASLNLVNDVIIDFVSLCADHGIEVDLKADQYDFEVEEYEEELDNILGRLFHFTKKKQRYVAIPKGVFKELIDELSKCLHEIGVDVINVELRGQTERFSSIGDYGLSDRWSEMNYGPDYLFSGEYSHVVTCISLTRYVSDEEVCKCAAKYLEKEYGIPYTEELLTFYNYVFR